MAHTTRYGVASPILPTSVVFLIVLAALYNAVLAVLNAAGLHQSYTSVALVEGGLLVAATGYIAGAHVPVFNRLAATIMILGVGVTLHVTLASGKPALDCARAAVVIGVFLILGSAATERQILLAFRILSGLVLAGLVLELADTPLYVKIFQPAAYYSATRGIEEFSLDNSGLFRNALGFASRFSFGLSSHRTSSVFIEQVSLANFAGVLCVFLLACYSRMRLADRVLHLATAVLIILTNDSRTSSFIAALSFLGFFIYPLLPPALAFAVLPGILGVGMGLVGVLGATQGDDFRGRISTTVRHLQDLGLGDYFGFGGRMITTLMDSGYPYVIASSTIFGLLFLWFFVASALRADTPSRLRCLFGLNIFICTNLMIGGTAVFSIKVAAPLWALVGYMGYRRRIRPAYRAQHVVEATASGTLAMKGP